MNLYILKLNLNNIFSLLVCSCLRAPQLRIRPMPCPNSGVRAKLYIIYLVTLKIDSYLSALASLKLFDVYHVGTIIFYDFMEQFRLYGTVVAILVDVSRLFGLN